MSEIKIPKKPIKVAIFGSCTTRDIFNRKFNPDYKDYFEVVSFQNQTSILSLMSAPVKHTDKSLSPLEGWNKKSIKSEFDKVFLVDILKTKPDVLIVDFFADARFKSITVDNTFITVNEWKTTKSDFYQELSKQNTPFKPTESQLKESMQAFNIYIQKHLPETKIILNQARGAKSYTNTEGKEEFFNQTFVNSLNQRWSMIDNLFIDIVNPIQIDVMSPSTKGFIDHIRSLGYVYYTPNFYHNFLKTLMSTQLQNQVEFLESSLAKLVPTGIFPEEKLTLLEDIRSVYISLNTQDTHTIDTWLNGRYKLFLTHLVDYNKNIHHYVKFISYAFRGGLKNTIVRDVSFAQFLLEPVIDGSLFAQEKKSAYAYLNYGNIMYHNFVTSTHSSELPTYFKQSHVALLFTHKNGKTDYLKNRSAYFLSHLYAANKDFNTALTWYKKALDTDKPAANIHSLPFLMLFRSMGINASEIFEDITLIFNKNNVQNKDFWVYFQNEVENNTLKNNIQTIINTCHTEKKTGKKWRTQKIEDFFLTVRHYVRQTVDFAEDTSSDELQSLYRNSLLKNKAKATVLFKMANIYAHKHHDISRAILMASESNTMKYDKEKSHFISTLILKCNSPEIRNILSDELYAFKSASVNGYVKEHTRNIAAWKRFLNRGFVSGRFNEEVDFLEFLLIYTEDTNLQKILKTRLAYLYYTGTSGLSEDNHETPNIPKAKEYFQSIKGNPLIRKYLIHPRLSIYQDMEQFLDNKKENYLFFENTQSDELLIVFSCAGSYSRYTQLNVFYEKNQTNVLFLNNPPYNWYHGSEWTRIKKTIEEVALKNFKKENITTYFGSMGGYAALRTGLEYGFRTIVFNPQIDLDIWMKHRPAISVRLLKEKKLYHLQNMQTSAFEQTPLYYATSSAMEDVEAFKLLVHKLSLCKEGLFIIEKIPDNNHEGIFGLIYKNKQQDALLNISKIQKNYFPSNKYTILNNVMLVEDVKSFWNFIIRSMQLRIIIQISDANIYCAHVEHNFLSPLKLHPLENDIV